MEDMRHNPSAFPQSDFCFPIPERAGMTLRDWFAGQALAGCMAAEAPDVIYEEQGVAKRAYRIADAMLSARQTTDREDGK